MPPSSFDEGWHQVSEVLDPLRSFVTGYRQQMLDLGFPPEHAAAMAADIHRFAVASMISTLRPQKGAADAG